MKLKKWIVFNDVHFPFQDETCLSLMMQLGRKIKPDGYVILGDLVDFYTLSSFDQDPERAGTLQVELDMAMDFLGKLSKQNPRSRIVYVEGNHEKRLQKSIWKKPQYYSLRALTVPALLELPRMGIQYQGARGKRAARFKLGDLFLYHGSIVRKHSGYSAKGMYDKHGVSLMCGHTHRDGKYTIRTEDGHFAAWENYCMCSLDPEYVDFANWTQGFSVVTLKGKRPYVEQIPILGNSFIYGGTVYE